MVIIPCVADQGDNATKVSMIKLYISSLNPRTEVMPPSHTSWLLLRISLFVHMLERHAKQAQRAMRVMTVAVSCLHSVSAVASVNRVR